MIINDVVFLHS